MGGLTDEHQTHLPQRSIANFFPFIKVQFEGLNVKCISVFLIGVQSHENKSRY